MQPRSPDDNTRSGKIDELGPVEPSPRGAALALKELALIADAEVRLLQQLARFVAEALRNDPARQVSTPPLDGGPSMRDNIPHERTTSEDHEGSG